MITKGPWYEPHICDDDHSCNCRTIVNERYASGIATVVVGNDLPIGEGGIDGPSKEEAAANARLIAAAPDLLEAVKVALTTPGMIKGRDLLEAALTRAQPQETALSDKVTS